MDEKSAKEHTQAICDCDDGRFFAVCVFLFVPASVFLCILSAPKYKYINVPTFSFLNVPSISTAAKSICPILSLVLVSLAALDTFTPNPHSIDTLCIQD